MLRVQLALAARLEPQVLSLGEVAAGGDAGNAEGGAPRIAERDALSAAAGAHQLCGESQGSGGEARPEA